MFIHKATLFTQLLLLTSVVLSSNSTKSNEQQLTVSPLTKKTELASSVKEPNLENLRSIVFIVKPKRHHEECIELNQHEQVEFTFTGSDVIRFNVHYHHAEGIAYPIADQATNRFAETIFTAMNSELYCWMWSNEQDQSVKVNFSLFRKSNK